MKTEFIPLYCKEHLTLINPFGLVGIITLWSRTGFVCEKFQSLVIDLNPGTSPIAVFGNLYGNGLKYLLANLLYNPQIRFLVVCGWNRSGSLEELQNFFRLGVEEYKSLGMTRNRVIGTERTLDTCLNPHLFVSPPEIVVFGDINDQETQRQLKKFFHDLSKSNIFENISLPKRVELELPGVSVHYFPSNPRSHTVVKNTPLEAWKELIFCLHRFGRLVNLGSKKGDRIELQNIKVIVENPCEEPPQELEAYGFCPDLFKTYQEGLLKAEIRQGEEAYNYGNRLRAYFGIDGLADCIQKLNKNPQTRRAFLVLWDPKKDLTDTSRSSPCLTSIFFRVFEDKLTLTAIFRVHNAVTAWLQNFYGLIAVQRYVSQETGIEPGAITVISLSISINTLEYDRAQAVVKEKEKKLEFETDPNGQFRFTLENGEIVVSHIYQGEVIAQYRSRKAERIQYELKRDRAISDIAHAIFVGRQMERAEQCLKTGEQFVEE